MNKPIDKTLLFSYFSGNASSEQKRQIELWLNDDPTYSKFFYQCLEEWERKHQKVDVDLDKEFENLTKRIQLSEILANASQKEKKVSIESAMYVNSMHTVTGKAGISKPINQYINRWQKMAAAVVVLIVCSALFFFLYTYNKSTVYTTAYGETKKVLLPDNSTIVLNANSRIEFSADWDQEKPREVRLDGEAFFSVVHTATHQKFIVHTCDNFSIEVLGTQFNVSRRESKTRVVLNSGKIRLHLNDKANNSKEEAVTMQPGELVEFKKSPRQFIKKTVNPELYSSWTDNRLIFENTSLDELSTLLEERYGLQIVVGDTSLKGIRFNGDFPSDDLNILLKALAATYDLKITTRSKEIHFEPHTNRK